MDVSAIHGLATVSAVGALIGYFGGRASQVLLPSVSPIGYSLSFGLTPWTGLAIFNILSSASRLNELAKVILSVVGGYLSSVAIANLLGCDVTLIGPFMGTLSLAGSIAIIAIVVTPLIGIGAATYYMAT